MISFSYLHHQYSFYATQVIGVQLILIRPVPIDNICPGCSVNNNELTSFPIMSNESFTFGYNEKRGVELEFKHRRKRA